MTSPKITITSAPFGHHDDGDVTLYTMHNSDGIKVKFINYGGIIVSIETPDRDGHYDDVVLGFDTLKEYQTKSIEGGLYFGALIGRYANRIANGRFELDGECHSLPINNSPNALHGGPKGFHQKLWDVELHQSQEKASATLTCISPDGEEGFPGNLAVSVTYSLNKDNEFSIRYQAKTDAPTVINLTNHVYFNLAGMQARNDVSEQLLMVNAHHYTPTNQHAIPLGESAAVAGTPFDFLTLTPIGKRLRDVNQQLIYAHGYDHNWVLDKKDPSIQELAVRVEDPHSGRTLECLTTHPGVQIYTANGFNGEYAGKGRSYRQGDGFTLETQHFPDSPNQPGFPTTVLRPGEVYDHTTVFRFGVR